MRLQINQKEELVVKYVKKKNGSIVEYNETRIVDAIAKSASRVMVDISAREYRKILDKVNSLTDNIEGNIIPIKVMHSCVEVALEEVNPKVAKSYKDYRNYKIEFVSILDDVYHKDISIRYRGDKENSNTDSALIPTKRSLIYNELNRRLYQKFNMNDEERQACEEGYIYEHDQNARRDTMRNIVA